MDTGTFTLQLWNVAVRPPTVLDHGHLMTVVLRGGPRSGLNLTTTVHGGPIEHLTHGGHTYCDSGQARRGVRIFDWLPDCRRRQTASA